MSRAMDNDIHTLVGGEPTDAPPHYSTVDAVALTVIDKMQASGWFALMSVGDGTWRISFDYSTPQHPQYGDPSTLGSGKYPEYHGTPQSTFAAAVCDAVMATRVPAKGEDSDPPYVRQPSDPYDPASEPTPSDPYRRHFCGVCEEDWTEGHRCPPRAYNGHEAGCDCFDCFDRFRPPQETVTTQTITRARSDARVAEAVHNERMNTPGLTDYVAEKVAEAVRELEAEITRLRTTLA